MLATKAFTFSPVTGCKSLKKLFFDAVSVDREFCLHVKIISSSTQLTVFIHSISNKFDLSADDIDFSHFIHNNLADLVKCSK